MITFGELLESLYAGPVPDDPQEMATRLLISSLVHRFKLHHELIPREDEIRRDINPEGT